MIINKQSATRYVSHGWNLNSVLLWDGKEAISLCTLQNKLSLGKPIASVILIVKTA